MTQISDPAVDGLIRHHARAPQPDAQVQVAAPINNFQLVALMAAHLSSWKPKPDQAVSYALQLFGEVVAQVGPNGEGLKRAIGQAQARVFATTPKPA